MLWSTGNNRGGGGTLLVVFLWDTFNLVIGIIISFLSKICSRRGRSFCAENGNAKTYKSLNGIWCRTSSRFTATLKMGFISILSTKLSTFQIQSRGISTKPTFVTDFCITYYIGRSIPFSTRHSLQIHIRAENGKVRIRRWIDFERSATKPQRITREQYGYSRVTLGSSSLQ